MSFRVGINPAQLNRLVKAYLKGVRCKVCGSKFVAYWPIYENWFCYTCGCWFRK
jgi:hypothetical protein